MIDKDSGHTSLPIELTLVWPPFFEVIFTVDKVCWANPCSSKEVPVIGISQLDVVFSLVICVRIPVDDYIGDSVMSR